MPIVASLLLSTVSGPASHSFTYGTGTGFAPFHVQALSTVIGEVVVVNFQRSAHERGQ